jgi:hypothetical protein
MCVAAQPLTDQLSIRVASDMESFYFNIVEDIIYFVSEGPN